MSKISRRGKNGVFYITYQDRRGRQRRKSLKTTDQTIAENIQKEIDYKVLLNEYEFVKIRKRYSEAIKEYITDRISEYPDRKYRQSKTHIDRFMCFISDDDKPLQFISDVTSEDVKKFKAMLLDTMKPTSSIRIMGSLRAFLKWCFRKKYVRDDVLMDVPRIRLIVKDDPLYLEKEEVDILLDAAKFPYKQMYALAIYAGLRRGEILHLRHEDLNFKDRFICVSNKEDWKTKSGKERFVPMFPALFDILKPFRFKTEGYVFPTRNGTLIAGSDLWAVIQRHKNILPKEKLNFCVLRHTFATQLIADGVDIYTVSKLLGHTTVQTSERSYICFKDRKPEEYKNIGKWLKSKKDRGDDNAAAVVG